MDSNQDTTLNTNTSGTTGSESTVYRFRAEELAAVGGTVNGDLPHMVSDTDTIPPATGTSEATVNTDSDSDAANTDCVASDSDTTGTEDPQAIDAPFTEVVTDLPLQKKKHPFLKKLLGCIGLAACFGIIAGGSFFGVNYAVSRLLSQEGEPLEMPNELTTPLQSKPDISISSTEISEVGETDATETVSAVVEQTMPAMVSIQTVHTTTSYFWGQPITNEQEGGGSGIIVGSNESDLLIATNYHVIEDTSSVKIILADNTTHDASVKGTDADADLAILALPLSGLSQETLDSIDIAVLGDSDSARIGQMVIAIGNALGYGPTVTVGYLSAKDREVTIQGNDMVLLQTNAAINSGNSGGALLNTKGEVIGINNAKLTSTDIEGICFAIPISEATPILDDLMTREILSEEEKGYLGVSVTDSTLANWPDGVYISAVTEGSAAQVAGIYEGDIITHVNGEAVTTANQLINAVTAHRHGTVIEITVQRIIEGTFKEFTYSVTLQKHPDLLKAESTPTPPSSDRQRPR